MNSRRRYAVLVMAIGAVCLSGCTGPRAGVGQPQGTNAAVQWTGRPFRNNPANFQFAVVCDRMGGGRPEVFKKAMQQANLLQPEFVVCVGDLIDGGIDNREVIKAQYDEMDSIVNSLEMRFFRVVGNHDISNATMADMYRGRYGSPYYHFVYKNALFLIVCTEDPPQTSISDAQVGYMKKALEDNSNVRWTFVFMHEPLFIKQGDTLHEGWAKIEDMLKDRPHTVLAGHWHQYAKYEKNARSYICLATTGGGSDLSGVASGMFDEIVWVTMTDEGPRIANLMLDGILDENVRRAQ